MSRSRRLFSSHRLATYELTRAEQEKRWRKQWKKSVTGRMRRLLDDDARNNQVLLHNVNEKLDQLEQQQSAELLKLFFVTIVGFAAGGFVFLFRWAVSVLHPVFVLINRVVSFLLKACQRARAPADAANSAAAAGGAATSATNDTEPTRAAGGRRASDRGGLLRRQSRRHSRQGLAATLPARFTFDTPKDSGYSSSSESSDESAWSDVSRRSDRSAGGSWANHGPSRRPSRGLGRVGSGSTAGGGSANGVGVDTPSGFGGLSDSLVPRGGGGVDGTGGAVDGAMDPAPGLGVDGGAAGGPVLRSPSLGPAAAGFNFAPYDRVRGGGPVAPGTGTPGTLAVPNMPALPGAWSADVVDPSPASLRRVRSAVPASYLAGHTGTPGMLDPGAVSRADSTGGGGGGGGVGDGNGTGASAAFFGRHGIGGDVPARPHALDNRALDGLIDEQVDTESEADVSSSGRRRHRRDRTRSPPMAASSAGNDGRMRLPGYGLGSTNGFPAGSSRGVDAGRNAVDGSALDPLGHSGDPLLRRHSQATAHNGVDGGGSAAPDTVRYAADGERLSSAGAGVAGGVDRRMGGPVNSMSFVDPSSAARQRQQLLRLQQQQAALHRQMLMQHYARRAAAGPSGSGSIGGGSAGSRSRRSARSARSGRGPARTYSQATLKRGMPMDPRFYGAGML